MQVINVKKRELSIKNPNRVINEDDVAPELIRFVISDASNIENVEELNFYLQYKNRLGEYGAEALTSSYADGVLTLDWLPSGVFSKESGRVEIQLIGYTVSNSDPTTRWSSIKTTITLPENIGSEITLIDKRQRARLAGILR